VMLWISHLDYLTSSQVAKLVFWGEPTPKTGQPRSLPNAQKAANEMCLRRLKDHGLVKTIAVPIELPKGFGRGEINLLTKKGVEFMNAQLEDKDSPARLTFRADQERMSMLSYPHTLKINDVIANLVGAFRQQGGVVQLVINNRRLTNMINERDGSTLLQDIYPDAVLVMRFGDTTRCYLLEVDRGTEGVSSSSRSSFDKKIQKYGNYFKTQFTNDPLFAGMDQPQVLIVTTGNTRAHNLMEATFKAGGRRAYWITAYEYITPPDLTATDAIWLVPTTEGYQTLSLSD
jgi:hypothetical protein